MKKISVFIIILLFIMLGASASAQNKVLATIGSEKITIDDFNDRLEELPAQFRGYYSSEQGKNKFLEQLIQERLLYLQAKAKGIEKETEVSDAVERAKKNIIVAHYVNKYLKNVVVTDKELKDHYNANKNKFRAPAKIQASHILVETNSKALQILKKLKAGEDFDVLAKKESIAPNAKESADVGWFEKGQMVKPFETAAFAMNVGEISQPVQTQYGYHIIKITEKVPARQKDFAQVKATIREELLREAQNKKLDSMVAKLKEKTTIKINQETLSKF